MPELKRGHPTKRRKVSKGRSVDGIEKKKGILFFPEDRGIPLIN